MIHNPVIDTMLNRKSIRKYTKETPSDEVLETIVRAAQQAPFAAQMCSLLLSRREGKIPYGAPLLFTICVDAYKLEQVMVAVTIRGLLAVRLESLRPVAAEDEKIEPLVALPNDAASPTPRTGQIAAARASLLGYEGPQRGTIEALAVTGGLHIPPFFAPERA